MSEVAARVRLSLDRAAVWTALLDDPARWLPLPAVAIGDGAWRSVLGVGPLTHAALVHLGDGSLTATACRRSLAWEPLRHHPEQHARNLPDLAGSIAASRDPDGLHLEVAGSYLPPGGALGARIDAVALHRVAEATVQRFAREVARRVQGLVTSA